MPPKPMGGPMPPKPMGGPMPPPVPEVKVPVVEAPKVEAPTIAPPPGPAPPVMAPPAEAPKVKEPEKAPERPKSPARETIDELKQKIGIIEDQVKTKGPAAPGAKKEDGVAMILKEMAEDIKFIHELSQRIKNLEDAVDRKNATIVELQEKLDDKGRDLEAINKKFGDLEKQMHMELSMIRKEIGGK